MEQHKFHQSVMVFLLQQYFLVYSKKVEETSNHSDLRYVESKNGLDQLPMEESKLKYVGLTNVYKHCVYVVNVLTQHGTKSTNWVCILGKRLTVLVSWFPKVKYLPDTMPSCSMRLRAASSLMKRKTHCYELCTSNVQKQ